MDSQLAVAQTSNSLDDQNDSQPLDESGPKVLVGPTDKTLPSTLASNLQPFPSTAVTSRHVSSINGETSASVGGPSKLASLKTCKSDGLKRPIKVKTGMPLLNNQPTRIKIIVPQRGKHPIISTTTSLTKELPPSAFTSSALVSPETVSTGLVTDKNTGETLHAPSLPAIMNERGTAEAILERVAIPKAGSLEREMPEGMKEASDTEDDNTNQQSDSTTTSHSPAPQHSLVPGTDTAVPGQPRPSEEAGVGSCEDAAPLNLQKVGVKGHEVEVEGEVAVTEEQTEPLDLSLPKKKGDADGRRCGRSLEDSGYESSLIMEVDEFEGDGDRDVVEEDKADDDVVDVARKGDQTFHPVDADSFGDSILSPSFFSTSVFASLSSIDSDNDNFLFIDDQGIPYNLSPEGHKVPQIDTSKLDGRFSGHSVTPSHALHAERREPSELVTLLASDLGQSSENPLRVFIPSRDNLLTSPPASATESPPRSLDPLKAAELTTGELATKTSESSEVPETCGASASQTGTGTMASNQTLQILTNPSGNTPILLLSSPSSSTQFSSSPTGLSLPLPVTQNSSAPVSNHMLLLLSSVSSSSSSPGSQALALLDPSTGRLSQITAASSGPLPFPTMSAGQVSKPGSSILSYPMIQLGPNNASVVLSGVSNSLTANLVPLIPFSVSSTLSPSSSTTTTTTTILTPTIQTTSLIPSVGAFSTGAPPLVQTQTKSSDANVEAEVISKEGNAKPSPVRSGSPPPLLNYHVTFDTLEPLSPPTEADPTSASEPGMDPSRRLAPGMDVVPLEDHLYFSSMGGPPSPSIFTSSQLDAMDPLDPLSPASSPNSLGPRKVMYCQLCPRVFFYMSDLERHAITHSQKKPHVCQLCGKAFKRSSHLQVCGDAVYILLRLYCSKQTQTVWLDDTGAQKSSNMLHRMRYLDYGHYVNTVSYK